MRDEKMENYPVEPYLVLDLDDALGRPGRQLEHRLAVVRRAAVAVRLAFALRLLGRRARRRGTRAGM